MFKSYSLIFLVGFNLLFSVRPIYAHPVQKTNFSKNLEAIAFMEKIAEKYEYDLEDLHHILETVVWDQKKKVVFDRVNRPAEKILNWKSYQKGLLTQERVKAGKIFWKQHGEILAQVSSRFKVPVLLMVATLGIESFYGKHNGRYRVIDSLIMLSFTANRRKKFYQGELREFFIFAKENFWNLEQITSVKGSYSGAIGPAQFIPSSINYSSFDWNNDGKKNLLSDFEDIIASVGYYYRRAKWKAGKKIVRKLKTKPRGLKDRKDIIVVQGNHGKEYWKKYPNFNTILRYNNSKLYVLAIYNLGKRIALVK